jgi:TetR/AcrR family transcriptional repressor of mexJK operon
VRVPDPVRAAEHFAFLVVGATLDRVMFEGEAAVPPAAELEERARAGVEVWLAAYAEGLPGRSRGGGRDRQ